MSNRKIVFLNHEVYSYNIARAREAYAICESANWDFIFYATEPIDNTLPAENYLNLLDGIPTRILYKKIGSYNDPRKINDVLLQLKRDNPDVIAIFGYSTRLERMVLGYCRKYGRGAILLCDSQAIDFPRSYLKELFKKVIVHLYDSAFVAGTPQKNYLNQLGMPINRIFTKHTVIDNEFWIQGTEKVREDSNLWKAKLGLSEKYFLTVCRFVPKKNLVGLIEAYYEYINSSSGNPWHLVIIGTGPLENKIRELICTLKLSNYIHLPGYLNVYQLIPYYALASTFILASDHEEQWGLVINEAMASGLPVIASEVCGASNDLIIEGVTGYKFNPKNKRQLTDLMIRFHENAVNWDQMSKNAIELIKTWSPKEYSKSLLGALETAWDYSQSRKWKIWPSEIWWL
jgi:glycosyltransferase involved in cell wall biosynthesis